MPKIHDMLESKFLKKDDVGPGRLLTIEGVIQNNVAKQGAEPEMKWCLTFTDEDKPLVLNSTNIQLCQHIFGSDDTDDWLHKQIVLYADPTIMYAGKVVGGIRVRAPKKRQPPVAAPKPVAVPAEMVTDDEIPF
jgi:hypothetical protein